MQYMLAGQLLPEHDADYIERVSIPAILTEETVKLFSGQIVPVIKVNSPRGMYGWKVNIAPAKTVRTKNAIPSYELCRYCLELSRGSAQIIGVKGLLGF